MSLSVSSFFVSMNPGGFCICCLSGFGWSL